MIFEEQARLTFQKAIPIIEALNKFKKDTGHYPKELTELKGGYLKEIPITAIGIFSTQEYYYGSYDGKFELFIYDHFLNLGVYLYDSDHPERGWYYED